MSTYRGSYTGSVSTIASTVKQQEYLEYQRKKQRQKLNQSTMGAGVRPLKYGIVFGIIGSAVFIAGVVMLILQLTQTHLFGSEGDMTGFIGPALMAIGVLIVALAVYLFMKARRKSNQARAQMTFMPTGMGSVSAVNPSYQIDRTDLRSGSASIGTRTPIGSTNGSINEYPQPITPTGSMGSSLYHGASASRPPGRHHHHHQHRSTGGSSLRRSAMSTGSRAEQVPSFAEPAPYYSPPMSYGEGTTPEPTESVPDQYSPNPAATPGSYQSGSVKRYRRHDPPAASPSPNKTVRESEL